MPCGGPTLSDALPRPLLRQAARALPLMFQLLHRRWTAETDEHLVRMFNRGVGPAEMAKALKRTTDATEMHRLKLDREGRCPTS